MIDTKKYTPLKKAAEFLCVGLKDLCDLILDTDFKVFAESEYADNLKDSVFQIKLSTIVDVLAADKKVNEVEFIYPPKIKRLRLKAGPTDKQTIKRKDLYLLANQLGFIDQLITDRKDLADLQKRRTRKKRKSTRIKDNSGSGGHWELRRKKVLSAANVELRQNFSKYLKPNGTINKAKLRDFLFESKIKYIWQLSGKKTKRDLKEKAVYECLCRCDREGLLHKPKNSTRIKAT